MGTWLKLLTLSLAVLSAGCSHQAYTDYRVNNGFSDAQIDQMLAPIALYPDVVLSQILMASTYPQELYEAAHWSREHRHLRGSRATDAVAGFPWDPSIMALVAFPNLLQQLNSDPNWTQQLGEAYIYQEADVVASIQRLRSRAYRSGHLRNLDHLHVYRDHDFYVIEPINPGLVYLPYYRPTVVYGNWWWPEYPPHYWNEPYGYRSGITFYWGHGFTLSSGFFYSGFHWRDRYIVTFDRSHYRNSFRKDHRYNYRHHYRDAKRWHRKAHRAADRQHYRRDTNVNRHRYQQSPDRVYNNHKGDGAKARRTPGHRSTHPVTPRGARNQEFRREHRDNSNAERQFQQKPEHNAQQRPDLRRHREKAVTPDRGRRESRASRVYAPNIGKKRAIPIDPDVNRNPGTDTPHRGAPQQRRSPEATPGHRLHQQVPGAEPSRRDARPGEHKARRKTRAEQRYPTKAQQQQTRSYDQSSRAVQDNPRVRFRAKYQSGQDAAGRDARRGRGPFHQRHKDK